MMSNLGFGFDNDYYQNMKHFDEDEIETVLVFLEDMADLLVWGVCFPNNKPINFEFRSTEQFVFTDKIVSSGCDRILSLVKKGDIVLGHNVIACLDSDHHEMTNFRNTPYGEYYKNPNIYLTRLHSLENIQYHFNNIDELLADSVCKHVSALTLKPSDIAKELSNQIYPAFSKYLFLSSFENNKKALAISGYGKLKKTIKYMSSVEKTSCTNNSSLLNSSHWRQGVSRLSDINTSLTQAISDLNKSNEYTAYCSNWNHKGFTMDNAYLFMRGHNINDFFVSILDKTYDLYTQQECQRLVQICTQNNKSPEVIQQKVEHYKQTTQLFSSLKKKLLVPVNSIHLFSQTAQSIAQVY